MGSAYLTFILGKWIAGKCGKDGVSKLWEHQRHISPVWLTVFIIVLCLLGAATLALDSLAFVYLDLATKQVIDSVFPVMVQITAPVLGYLLDQCRPIDYIVFTDDEVEEVRRRPKFRVIQTVQAVFVLLMVISSVFVVWVTPSVSWTGVIINSITLVTSALGLVVLETILKWRAYSKFGLMVVTIMPEIVVLMGVSIYLGEAYPERVYIVHAICVGLVEVVLKVLAFYLLRAAGSVELSVTGVVVFVIVVALDTFWTGKAGPMRIGGLIATTVFLIGYTSMGYLWRRKELQLQTAQVSREKVGQGNQGLPFDFIENGSSSSDEFRLPTRYEMAGIVPSRRSFTDEDPLGVGEFFRKPRERRASVADLSISGDTEYSESSGGARTGSA
jgi:hypothetical protein